MVEKGCSGNRLLTLANFFTCLRLLGLPVFMWLILAQHEYADAVVVLALIGITDWADGFVARRMHQVSSLGRLLDPLADRLTFVVVAFTLSVSNIAPWWLFLVVLAPDVLLLMSSLVFFGSHPNLPVSVLGKVRTAAFLIGAPLFLLGKALTSEPVTVAGWVVVTLGIIGHWAAAHYYFWAMVSKYRQGRAAGNQKSGSLASGGARSPIP